MSFRFLKQLFSLFILSLILLKFVSCCLAEDCDPEGQKIVSINILQSGNNLLVGKNPIIIKGDIQFNNLTETDIPFTISNDEINIGS